MRGVVEGERRPGRLGHGGEWCWAAVVFGRSRMGKGAAVGREGRACELGRAGSGCRVRGETKWRPPLLRLPAP